MERYGLLGKHLSHSFSKMIHEQIAPYTYDLIEKNEEEVHEFLTQKDFNALNVTIPYKETVIPYLDEIDEKAKSIGAVNTIVNENGRLIGYNTDYDGFQAMVNRIKLDLQGKKVLILGNGGAAKAVKAVCRNNHAGQILCVSRHPKNGAVSYEEIFAHHTDVQVIINTSPCGMYPNIHASPLDLERFKSCEAVLDVIYNPLCTKLAYQASMNNIPAVCGLEMLIVQAIRAKEKFLHEQQNDEDFNRVYRSLLEKQRNIVLIGMPGAGKSTISKLVAEKLDKTCIDCDEEIVRSAQKSIPEIFKEQGEAGFRKIETDIVRQVSAKQDAVISTGGGVILHPENIEALKFNGIVIFIDRDVEKLVHDDDNRPLSAGKKAVKRLYEQRIEYYRKYADIIVDNNGPVEQTVEHMIQAFHEKTEEALHA